MKIQKIILAALLLSIGSTNYAFGSNDGDEREEILDAWTRYVLDEVTDEIMPHDIDEEVYHAQIGGWFNEFTKKCPNYSSHTSLEELASVLDNLIEKKAELSNQILPGPALTICREINRLFLQKPSYEIYKQEEEKLRGRYKQAIEDITLAPEHENFKKQLLISTPAYFDKLLPGSVDSHDKLLSEHYKSKLYQAAFHQNQIWPYEKLIPEEEQNIVSATQYNDWVHELQSLTPQERENRKRCVPMPPRNESRSLSETVKAILKIPFYGMKSTMQRALIGHHDRFHSSFPEPSCQSSALTTQ